LDSESPHRERAEIFHLHGHCKETETPIGQFLQPTQMFDNWDICLQQPGVYRSATISGIINIKRIDPYK
jgi:hypothetical protein